MNPMTAKGTHGNHAGKFVFVSGLSGGREIFLGRPIDESSHDAITIEGKGIAITPQGAMVVRPFPTTCTFPLKGSGYQVQQIHAPEALAEATNIFTFSIATITRATHPLTWRWIEAAFSAPSQAFGFGAGSPYPAAYSGRATGYGRTGYGQGNPFSGFYDGFQSSAEQFRRALFQSPQVGSTRELDQLTELEGDLTIEVGKATNQIAIKFNVIVGRNQELSRYFESIHGFSMPYPATNTVGGWCYLMGRLQMAKSWARRNGKTALVREVNALTKEGIHALNEVILEHCSALDTLITETFGQYGITFEIWGDLSPLAPYTSSYAGPHEPVEYAPTPVHAGYAGAAL